jgi:hypothetical protein
VHVNWKNDHTRNLQEIITETFRINDLVEFLCIAAFPESKFKYINSSLLKQALQINGNVTVLMDGFDEICAIHVDKAAVILSELKETNVPRVCVTSHPVQKEKLEKELSVIAFNMKILSPVASQDVPKTLDIQKIKLKQSTECGHRQPTTYASK